MRAAYAFFVSVYVYRTDAETGAEGCARLGQPVGDDPHIITNAVLLVPVTSEQVPRTSRMDYRHGLSP